ncbi:restriction endonuclease [Clostridium sp. CF012]|uniref:restriction endonuclease n=1 Tax=Clostridium sp. CF012 TaxID=2843319 RepID=UPI001C0D01A0|nr:restriction endonuclease [Clostridium sp. CF012]MBU3145594.1 restriction endonuclease [Clostridium sp. CF012]
MALLNFKEIPPANKPDGNQDTFELFAREVLDMLGFEILVNPDRGQDGGRDIIAQEKRIGILNDTQVKWLVSCKHNAHSGTSVVNGDEEDITDRVRTHGCSGFLGFYSTVVSSPLNRKLEGLKKQFEVQIFDNEKIEKLLLMNELGKEIIQRFFPNSYQLVDDKTPSNLFTEYMPLKCSCCGKDLLGKDSLENYKGVVVFTEDIEFMETNFSKIKYVDIYWACKGVCDEKLESYHYSKGYSNGWEDISDIIIPYKYLQWVMSILNKIRNNEAEFTDEAFEKLKDFIIAVSQIVVKNQSKKDIRRILDLSVLPDWL